MPERLILTNVRLTPEEHRAAKQRALELGIPLSELLRRGLQLVLSGARTEGAEAREGPIPYGAGRRGGEPHGGGVAAPVEPGREPAPAVDRSGRLAVLARTAGALRSYDAWMEELDRLRGQPLRHPTWAGGVEGGTDGRPDGGSGATDEARAVPPHLHPGRPTRGEGA